VPRAIVRTERERYKRFLIAEIAEKARRDCGEKRGRKEYCERPFIFFHFAVVFLRDPVANSVLSG
jgi:hypothetical protein